MREKRKLSLGSKSGVRWYWMPWTRSAYRSILTERSRSWLASQGAYVSPGPAKVYTSSQQRPGTSQNSAAGAEVTQLQTLQQWLSESPEPDGETGQEGEPLTGVSGAPDLGASTAGSGKVSDMQAQRVQRPNTKPRQGPAKKVRMTVWMTEETRRQIRVWAGAYPEYSESQVAEAAIRSGMEHEINSDVSMARFLMYLKDGRDIPT